MGMEGRNQRNRRLHDGKKQKAKDLQVPEMRNETSQEFEYWS